MPYVRKTKRKPSASKRLKIIMAACLVVSAVLGIGALFAAQQDRLAQNAAEAANFTPAPLATPGPTESEEPNPKAVILGDSYTAGSGAPTGQGYADALFGLMGWDGTALGQGGTGYTNPGQADQDEEAYLGRVDEVVEAAPEIVVVQGSTNEFELGELPAAADALYAAIRAELPDARLVVIGPVAVPAVEASRIDAIRTALADAAAEHQATFIDPAAEGWLDDPAYFGDGIHPTVEGHRLLAELIRDELSEG